ncbi:MAG TPA: polysaccharide biosynthesis C-terminal domain-containing protein, partial [Methylocystis sp.]|nr:polysaccharide biosynthesis C-terminal domain-containing protein [Methylocystis sp.]
RKGGLAQVSLNGVLLVGLLAPALVGAALLARPLVTLLIAENFREATIVILPIAMLAASIRFLRLHVSDQTMLLTERVELAMRITVAETIMNAGYCALGLHFGGLYGAAVGMTIGTTLASTAAFAICFGPLGLPAPAPTAILRILLAAAAMGAAVRSLPAPTTALGFATVVCFGAAIYAAAILVAFRECRELVGRRLKRGVGAPAL